VTRHCFGYAPHIAFIHRLTGLTWPALPDMVMYLAAGATIVSLLFALLLRLTDPVRKMVSSADDFITWIVIFLPVATGMAVLAEPSAAILLALELMLMLMWLPFGKLMHAFLFPFSRGATGIRLSHRGVKI
jgi:nitrate reductase gamma subunit